MLEAPVVLCDKSLTFQHPNNVHWNHGGNHAEISHVFESKSVHVVNMVTYIIYINTKQQAIEK